MSTRRSRSWATTFRPRLAKNRHGKHFVSFLPAVSTDATKAMGREIRSWHLARRSDKSLEDLARMFNSVVQGWINYYGRFYKSSCSTSSGASTRTWCGGPAEIQAAKRRERRAMAWLAEIARRSPQPVRALAPRRTS